MDRRFGFGRPRFGFGFGKPRFGFSFGIPFLLGASVGSSYNPYYGYGYGYPYPYY